jgi:hypothetical protein
MAFPYLSEESFESGTRGDFDAEQDDSVRLDFPHYTDLARYPGLAMPWRGAYCMRVDLALGTSDDAYVQENDDWDMTSGTDDLYGRFMLWIDPNIVMADTNEFSVLQYWSATNTVECGVYLNYTTANGLRIGIGEASADTSSMLSIATGEWHTVETFFDPETSSGTLDLWLDGGEATQKTGIASADITSGVLGVTGQDVGTTAGVLLFDSVVTDDTRLYPPTHRFDEETVLTKSGHLFVGPGVIDNISLISGAGTDCVVEIYDTDDANTNDEGSFVVRLSNTANNELVDPASMPARLMRGCYVKMSGTTPRALIKTKSAAGWGSDGAIRNHAYRR